MSFRAICRALLLSSLPVAGCGTVANLARPGPEGGGKAPFGGVKQDVWGMKTAANGESSSGIHPRSVTEQHSQVAKVVFYAADLPFSLVGDVLTWPYTATYSYINQPVPTPPVIQPPTPPVTQVTAEGPPPTSPADLLPGPRKLP